MEMNKELLEKAKTAKSEEELLALAKENNVEMTEESAKAYFELMQAQTKTGELSDEELDNVAGGGCHKDDGRLVITKFSTCHLFTCRYCGSGRESYPSRFDPWACSNHRNCSAPTISANCDNCKYMTYESGLWLCNHPAKRG